MIISRRNSHLAFSRRSIMGLALAGLTLPWLRSAPARAQNGAIPKRFLVVHIPEGVPVQDASIFGNTPDYFWPNEDVSSLPAASEPLARHRSRLTFLKGLSLSADGGDQHIQGLERVLTGDRFSAPDRVASVGGIEIPGGRSIDHVLGAHLGGATLYKSYGLGVLNHLQGDQNRRRVSFLSADHGVDVVNDPLRAFDDLLAGVVDRGASTGPSPTEIRLSSRKSVLDSVRAEIGSLRCRLGGDGRTKLDYFATSVREVETRIEGQLGGGKVTPITLERPAEETGSSDYWSDGGNCPEIGDLQMKTAAAALAADVTRVILFQWNASVSLQSYPWLNVDDKSKDAHGFAHASALEGDPAYWADQRRIVFTWYFEQLARFLDMLAEYKEVDGTSVLDNTLVLYCSEMGNGHHAEFDVPFVLAGNAGGAFRAGGRLVNYGGRTHNSLLATIAHGFGLTGAEFGRGDRQTGLFEEILA